MLFKLCNKAGTENGWIEVYYEMQPKSTVGVITHSNHMMVLVALGCNPPRFQLSIGRLA